MTGERSESSVWREEVTADGVRIYELDMRKVVTVFFQNIRVLALGTIGFTAFFIGLSFWFPNVYKSEMVLAPAGSDDASLLNSVSGQFGGLAKIAGLNLSSGLDRTVVAMEILRSRDFAHSFIQKHNIRAELMAAVDWSEEVNQLEYDSDVYDVEHSRWITKEGEKYEGGFSPEDIYDKYLDVVGVKQDRLTGLVVVSVEFLSPEHAKEWVGFLVEDLNAYTRNQDIAEFTNNILYLKDSLEKSSLAEINSIFYRLIEEETKKIMIASSRKEYVFKVIDSAVMPESPVRPKRILFAIVGLVFGVICSTIFIFSRKVVL
ncbi:GNVR domain-containing protein [Halioxenophilus sp. WMMB6]|uniref:GNVR domain-containing protein n=1 Tax=Halioxenophilus sp. WMMB6 TaxID=3073815 RepID=UPI00295EEF99|nr:GNVR domain-containing protein [Halioxenophilus sp. WMMB6]